MQIANCKDRVRRVVARDVAAEYSAKTRELLMMLVKAMSESLGLEGDRFSKAMDPSLACKFSLQTTTRPILVRTMSVRDCPLTPTTASSTLSSRTASTGSRSTTKGSGSSPNPFPVRSLSSPATSWR